MEIQIKERNFSLKAFLAVPYSVTPLVPDDDATGLAASADAADAAGLFRALVAGLDPDLAFALFFALGSGFFALVASCMPRHAAEGVM